jgi:ketosteroid isomerase-like protein
MPVMSMAEEQAVLSSTPQAITDAFNAHDLDAIMAFFSDDCTFDMPPRCRLEFRAAS